MIEINRWLYLGHSSVAATSAYLGIEQAKALDIAKNHRMFWSRVSKHSIIPANPSKCQT